MKKITNYSILLLLFISSNIIFAQTKETNKDKIEKLEILKQDIKQEEKDLLKIEVEAINQRLKQKEITQEEAQNLKNEAAKKRALNIKNRLAIIENKIEYYTRNDFDLENLPEENASISIGSNGITIKKEKKPVKYDIRTKRDINYAIGFNNAIIENQSLSDSPYKIGGSGFFELGYNLKTRLFKNSNTVRLSYGLTLQWNKYNIKNNRYFTQEGRNSTLQEFPIKVKKSKFRVTNLVVPIYFEFGPSIKVEKEDRIRYKENKFKFGIGGFAGVNISSNQKIKYEENGNKEKQKLKGNFNVSPFVYGVGTYIGYDNYALYVKYDISETFRNTAITQNNISLGVKLGLD